MNITFRMKDNYIHEFTTKNLMNKDLVIEQISIMKEDANNQEFCLMLDKVNNMNEYKQSYLIKMNDLKYQHDTINVLVPASNKWIFTIADNNGNIIRSDSSLIISLIINETKIDNKS